MGLLNAFKRTKSYSKQDLLRINHEIQTEQGKVEKAYQQLLIWGERNSSQLPDDAKEVLAESLETVKDSFERCERYYNDLMEDLETEGAQNKGKIRDKKNSYLNRVFEFKYGYNNLTNVMKACSRRIQGYDHG